MTAAECDIVPYWPPTPMEARALPLDSAEMRGCANSVLSGRAFQFDGRPAKIIVRCSATRCRQENDWRPDFVRRVLATDLAKHKGVVCEFEFILDEVSSVETVEHLLGAGYGK